MIDLTKEQEYVLSILQRWYKKPKRQYVTLGGYAGTGKTTLISLLREDLKKAYPELIVAFCSYTGKAARVLEQKLTEAKTKQKQDSVSTIHSLVYAPITNDNEEITGWKKKDEVKADLIIVDEASMVDSEIWNDLLSYGIPIIAVGDHGQLPPIKGSFNLMEKPDLRLEQIHRQAEGNPIIEISILAREKGEIPAEKFGRGVEKFLRSSDDAQMRISDLLERVDEETLLLCGFNATRSRLNAHMRSLKEFFTPEPKIGDRVICLRNNHEKNIYNGMLGTIKSIESDGEDGYFARIQMDDGLDYSGSIYAPQFGNKEGINFSNERAKIGKRDLFDFGYALTVHKAQGSQAKRVVLFEERSSHMDDDMWKKWLYTAVTRAEEELFIVGK
ncbi:AAA family ATPase [Candidatus Dojkabacteria bacterium]|uniref:AAA family ATPase n=1 Tax=Candidatus Dojkabacteria bacterium TaxID=2099670 RepID=A0A955LAK2_9BACT|nr:AAA family ATPase [Candidatus Dojkabacteria bacterium]